VAGDLPGVVAILARYFAAAETDECEIVLLQVFCGIYASVRDLGVDTFCLGFAHEYNRAK
jgi:hypothetical protein